jgi:hypothetical protein
MPDNWSGMTGDRSLVRIGTKTVDDASCPAYLAAKARPAMWPARRSRARKPRFDGFPLGAVMSAVDDVELRRLPLTAALDRVGQTGKPLHPGAARWARHAVAVYLDGAARIETPAVTPVPYYWVARRTSTEMTWEMYAWGRRYESPDQTVRELRLIRFGEADDLRAPANVAIAAYSAAFGVPAPWPERWSEPFQPVAASGAQVQWIRVLEIGLKDGSHAVLFEGTPEQAEALYATHSRALVREVAVGGAPEPGAGCADCKLVTTCDALLRIPGILGITGPTAPLRTWSVTNGRSYSVCPAQGHLLRLHLPREDEYGPAAVRGQAVHEWLRDSHAGPLHAACTASDIPSPPDDWRARRWRVTGHQAVAGSLMLACHADSCPFHQAGQITEVRLEPTIAVHDTAANVVVIAKPDMLYLDDGAWVWRETKTRWRLPTPGPDLFREYPQLALAAVLMAENVLGGKPSGRRIELELLARDGSDVLLVDPGDPLEVRRARAVLHELAAPWHVDEEAPARPGTHCADCPVRRWCPDAQTGAAS